MNRVTKDSSQVKKALDGKLSAAALKNLHAALLQQGKEDHELLSRAIDTYRGSCDLAKEVWDKVLEVEPTLRKYKIFKTGICTESIEYEDGKEIEGHEIIGVPLKNYSEALRLSTKYGLTIYYGLPSEEWEDSRFYVDREATGETAGFITGLGKYLLLREDEVEYLEGGIYDFDMTGEWLDGYSNIDELIEKRLKVEVVKDGAAV